MSKKMGEGMTIRERRERAAQDLARLFSAETTEAEVQQIRQWRTGAEAYQQEFMETAHLLGGLDVLVNDQEILSLLDEPAESETGRRTRWPALAVAAVLMLFVAVSLFNWFDPGADIVGDRYVTRIGEQRTVTLEDGSVLTLNTGTEILVSFNAANRYIKLLKGEAYFDVFSDAQHPFTVDLGERSVTVLGTEFNIYRQPDKFTLSVTEGMVSLHQTGERVSLSAPEIVTGSTQFEQLGVIGQHKVPAGIVAIYDAASENVSACRPENIQRLVSWRTGMIRFDEQPLDKVVEQLNRYSARPIVIEGSSIADINIYATVKLDAIDQTLDGLEYSLPIEVVREFDRIVIKAREPR